MSYEPYLDQFTPWINKLDEVVLTWEDFKLIEDEYDMMAAEWAAIVVNCELRKMTELKP